MESSGRAQILARPAVPEKPNGGHIGDEKEFMHMLSVKAFSNAVVGIAVLSLIAAPAASAAGRIDAPLAGSAPPQADRYVVQTLSPATAVAAGSRVAAGGGVVISTYSHVLTGFSASMTAEQAANLRLDPQVSSVIADEPTHTSTVQTSPPWGLDRIDQRTNPGDGTYNYDTTGAGVTAFIVDTGIRFTHTEFGGRAVSGWDFVDGDADASDCYGHGTHVSGTVGGRTFGVAKAVHYVSLRVWDCSGSGYFSDMISALDWAVAHKPAGPSVVNISGGGGAYQPMDDAVARTTAAGLTVVVAGMNSGDDACNYSPARAPSAITVGATDSGDTRAYFSDYGNCIDLFAPGVNIQSSVNTSDTASEFWNGTSMATPHVTGIAARYLQSNPSATPAQVTSAVLAAATPNVVLDPVGSPNRLAYVSPPVSLPSIPTDVRVNKSNATKSGFIAWSPPATDGGSPITGYRVTRNGTDSVGNGPQSVVVSAGTRTKSFTLLKPGGTYTMTVRAITAAGDGPAASGNITLAAVAPGIPTTVSVVRNDSTKIGSIRWSPPTSDGGSAITGYRVTRNGTDSAGNGPQSIVVSATSRSRSFSKLVAGRTYTLTVSAITAVGTGPAASGTITMK